MNVIRIGTRASQLALAQATEVRQRLTAQYPEYRYDIIPMSTEGDRRTQGSLAKIGGKGLFVKEIEEALLDKRIDIAVHSMKDVPSYMPDSLTMGAILPRENPQDALVTSLPSLHRLEDIPHGAKLGTSSTRRAAFLRHIRPDIDIVEFRGNVNTRLHKLEQGEVAATFLAVAGLHRLGLQQHIRHILPIEQMLPAVAQGAIGVQCRQDDAPIRLLLTAINHEDSAFQVEVERAVLQSLGGDCTTPLAAHAILLGDDVQLHAWLQTKNGLLKRYAGIKRSDAVESARHIGAELASLWNA